MRIRDGRGNELRYAEDHGGEKQAPEARAVEARHEDVGPDAAEQAASEAAEGEDRDMHGLALFDEGRWRGRIEVLPERLGVVADVTR